MVNFSLLSRYFAFTTFLLLFRFVLFCFVYLFLLNSDRVIFPSSHAFSSFFHYISYAFKCMYVTGNFMISAWFELGRKKGKARSWIVFQKQGLNENVSYMVCNGNKLSIQKG